MRPTTCAADAPLVVEELAAGALDDVADADAEAEPVLATPTEGCAERVWTVAPVAFVQETLLSTVTELRSVRSAH